MRTSTYEIILPLIDGDGNEIKGKALLVNGLCDALDVVDTQIAEKLRTGDLSDFPLGLWEHLITRGHITRKDEEAEAADAALLGRVWRKLMGLNSTGPVILPTYDCNFRCPYCFERHRLSRGQEWLGQTMKPEVIDAVFAALRAQRDKGQRIDHCSLYGGEPLLRENKETVRNICEHAKAMGLSLSGITNGYDLDAYMDLLEEYKFTELQITVDGVGEQNDCRRIHKDGVPTYERIMQNVALAVEHGINISLRVNVNGENIGGLKALIDDIKARDLNEELFDYYFKAVSESKDSPTKVSEQQVVDALIEAGTPTMEAIDRHSSYSGLKDALVGAMKKTAYPAFSPIYCGSEQNMLCIDPDGVIYSCFDHVAIEEQAVGYTDKDSGRFLFNFSKAKWRTRTSDLMEPCRKCPYIFICRGGCAAAAEMEYGDWTRENCGEIKEIFAFVASRVVGKMWEETKQDELSVSLAGPLMRLTEAEREILMTSRSQKEMFDIAKDAGFFMPADKEKQKTD